MNVTSAIEHEEANAQAALAAANLRRDKTVKFRLVAVTRHLETLKLKPSDILSPVFDEKGAFKVLSRGQYVGCLPRAIRDVVATARLTHNVHLTVVSGSLVRIRLYPKRLPSTVSYRVESVSPF